MSTGGPEDPPFTVRTVRWQDESAKLKAVRHEVFVIEQGVPLELELDEIDPDCLHALAEDEQGVAVGCGRLLPDAHIGRMAVLADWRGHGVGSAILAHLIELARRHGHPRVVLNAQTHATGFYRRFGFEDYGDTFDDAGLPHQAMQRSLDT
jgi:predicted GNAT family N-acyltransferase